MKQINQIFFSLLLTLSALFTSCIEPPLKLPAEEVVVDFPAIITDIEVVWNLDTEWKYRWFYGWDRVDSTLWGPIAYPIPTNYEVRRYYLGNTPGAPHKNVEGFTIFGNRFRRSYQFGYYDMLIWSNIDSDDGSQVLKVDEADLDSVYATTSVTRGLSRLFASESEEEEASGSSAVTGLYNQPEIFYSAYPRDIYISRNMEDYDYYDEDEHCWVKHINCELNPLTFIYLVQVIFLHNDGRVVGTTGNAALTAFSSGTNVNTGHTYNNPIIVYFNTRYKDHLTYRDSVTHYDYDCQIIGGKMTTFGLCDMKSFIEAPDHMYSGSRKDLPNYLMVDVKFNNGAEQTLQFNVTDQCREQSHGGIITVVIDCRDLEIPPGPTPGPNPSGSGSLFVPTVEDYDEVVYDIPLGN